MWHSVKDAGQKRLQYRRLPRAYGVHGVPDVCNLPEPVHGSCFRVGGTSFFVSLLVIVNLPDDFMKLPICSDF